MSTLPDDWTYVVVDFDGRYWIVRDVLAARLGLTVVWSGQGHDAAKAEVKRLAMLRYEAAGRTP